MKKYSLLFALFAFVLNLHSAKASIIRDTEVQSVVQELVAPISRAARFRPDEVKIVVIGNHSFNAFVLGGRRIFVHTGLISRIEDPLEFIGVMAHEMGHIVSGHFVSAVDLMEEYYWESLIGSVVGIAAALASKNGQLGLAMTNGAQTYALYKMLQHRRENESSADAVSLNLLKAAKISPRGLQKILTRIKDEYSYRDVSTNQYMRTHPITEDRIDFLRPHIHSSPHYESDLPKETLHRFKRIQAKIRGFLHEFQDIERWYPNPEETLYSKYCWSIVYFRQGDLKKSIALLDSLIEEHPNDPYFIELKAQVLFETGNVKESYPYFEKAIKMLPKSVLPKLMYAHALTKDKSPEKLNKALRMLSQIRYQERGNPFFWKLLSIVYWEQNRPGEANLALAEKALLEKRTFEAAHLARKAKSLIKNNPNAINKANEILKIIGADKEEKSQ